MDFTGSINIEGPPGKKRCSYLFSLMVFTRLANFLFCFALLFFFNVLTVCLACHPVLLLLFLNLKQQFIQIC